MEEIILWKGTIREIEPPEYGRPLLWFDCDYDSGHLIYDGKVTDKETHSHLLVLEHAYQKLLFHGKVDQRFTFSMKLYADYEDWAWDVHSSLIVGPIIQVIDGEGGVYHVMIRADETSGLISDKSGNVGLVFEKDRILGRLGQMVSLNLYLED